MRQMRPPLTMLALVLGCSVAHGQSLSKAAKDGISLVNDKQYRSAIPYLEDARDEQPTEAVIEEHLALAYLYSANGPDQKQMMTKAGTSARRAVELGGCASFFVDRSLEGWTSSSVMKVERGRLMFCKSRLEYSAERADTTFTATPEQIDEIDYNSRKGKDKSVFHVHLKDKDKLGKKKHDFRPASFTEREPDLLLELVEQDLDHSTEVRGTR